MQFSSWSSARGSFTLPCSFIALYAFPLTDPSILRILIPWTCPLLLPILLSLAPPTQHPSPRPSASLPLDLRNVHGSDFHQWSSYRYTTELTVDGAVIVGYVSIHDVNNDTWHTDLKFPHESTHNVHHTKKNAQTRTSRHVRWKTNWSVGSARVCWVMREDSPFTPTPTP